MSNLDSELRRIKIGIDVGGTFTHAVAVDLSTMELAGKAVVPTSHHAPEGVAKGVVDSMMTLLEMASIKPEEVILIAHSTTQATNALIEGDVAKVGIIGMSSGAGSIRARREANLGKIELSEGKYLHTCFRYMDVGGGLDEEAVRFAIGELKKEGAETIVSSESFGVDDPRKEERVAEIAREMGLPASASSALSQLYGLRVRTRTAVINASMLPKMLETANRTEEAVRQSGIKAPLMVMRSDGGIMDIEAMRRRPILTMLSGPAAGVAAALMYERITDGCMVEVGGTTSDICVIKNGRPIVTHGEIGGHRLFVKTLDVRTVGIAGGSVPRTGKNKLIEVGPRSAHIAKLGYDAFTKDIKTVEPTTVQPRDGDPSDYLALKINGETTPSITLTPTGASNILGLTSDYAKGDADSINKCFEAVAQWHGTTKEKLATQLLDLCVKKVGPVVKAMLEEHKMTKKKITFVGGGGGAEAIVPYTAKKLKLEHRIAQNTEVISAIGVALGIIQDTVEKTIMNPSESDLVSMRKEAFESVLRMGADSNSIEVLVEIDRQTKRVTATARGTPELRTRSLGGDLPSDEDLKLKAAKYFGIGTDGIEIQSGEDDWMQIFTAEKDKRILLGLLKTILTPVVIIDREGIIRLQLEDARVDRVTCGALEERMTEVLEQFTTFGDAGKVMPDLYIAKAGQIVDLTGLVEGSQMISVARVETQNMLASDEVSLISMRKSS